MTIKINEYITVSYTNATWQSMQEQERRWKTWIPKSVILNRKVKCTNFCGINREYALVAE